MSLEYLLTSGVYVVGFLALSALLMRVLIGTMAIKTLLFSLPVG